MKKYQYYCIKCKTFRDGLLDREDYAWYCPTKGCNGSIRVKEIK